MKTAEELAQALEEIFSDGMNFELYVGIGATDSRTYYRADLEDTESEKLCNSYVAGVRGYFQTENLSTIKLSEMDQRANSLVLYDLDEQPAELAVLASLGTGVAAPVYSFADHALSEITSIAIKISSATSSTVFFKKVYPVSLVKRDSILLLPIGTRFTVVNSDILRVASGFEVLSLNGEFYVNGFSKFEKTFGFEEIAKREMAKVTALIFTMNMVNDTKGHLASFQASKSDILRAAKSPVLNMAAQTVLNFAVSKQAQIGLKVVNGKFELSSRASVTKLYKLLNDDYLTSGLTAFEYETLAKNKLA